MTWTEFTICIILGVVIGGGLGFAVIYFTAPYCRK